MMQIHSVLCNQTGLQCQRSACLQAAKCVLGDPMQVVTQHVGANNYPMPSPNLGWKCPVCGKGNAPFQNLCANAACGIDFTQSTAGTSK